MKPIYLALSGLLALSACASAGQGIKAATIVDAKTNLAGYKTYAWLSSAEVLKDPNGAWVPVGFDVDKEVRWLIDNQLRDKKMSFAAESPDAYVMYILGVDMNTQAEKIKEVFGEEADLKNLTAGALVIALVDAQTGRAIWAGKAVAQTNVKLSDQQVRARLAAAVQKIFAGYRN